MNSGEQFFIVLERNQASQQIVEPDAPYLWEKLADAIAERDERTKESRAVGRKETFHIFQLSEVDEEDLWEWGVRHMFTGATSEGGQVMRYVGERAARRCARGDDVVVRRLVGASEWTPAGVEGGGEQPEEAANV